MAGLAAGTEPVGCTGEQLSPAACLRILRTHECQSPEDRLTTMRQSGLRPDGCSGSRKGGARARRFEPKLLLRFVKVPVGLALRRDHLVMADGARVRRFRCLTLQTPYLPRREARRGHQGGIGEEGGTHKPLQLRRSGDGPLRFPAEGLASNEMIHPRLQQFSSCPQFYLSKRRDGAYPEKEEA